jgi:5-methylcytosine-specific restriction enzyme subunit McrC
MQHYFTPIKFAKVFLSNQSFTSLRGDNNTFALLFDMNKVFEEYMAVVLNNSKDILGIDEVLINGGKDEYFLSNNTAGLEPDFLLKMKDKSYIVTDAKWKLLEDSISSNDVYQIFAYLNFYDCKDEAFLFVPKTDSLNEKKTFEYNTFNKNQTYKITILPIDLSDTTLMI